MYLIMLEHTCDTLSDNKQAGCTSWCTNLHVKKHDGYDCPLWGFVDDVCVGEPAVDKTGK